MAQLSIGDHVSDLKGAHEGKLVDIDGPTGYVLQGNGVEVEFPLSQLKPYEPPKIAAIRTLSGPLRDKLLTPSQKTLLASVPATLLAAIARSYDTGGAELGSRPVFAALPDSKRLDVIRIYLPTLPPRILAPHMNLVVAMRDIGKQSS
ncbi:hypothetical protein [Acetobacter oeni]|uniref:Uncharacterized protein n=1 Tax=Acetobacter oeni TaxID=304077 RepID=A0A511XJF6_9PROT|nr:hypothetical protein [Acetobacter oeni]MBB3882736.1 hypothetical protein [Acetobacter oeni]NHO18833.1 hypothetical protein [Acetobacter oeni]GBR03386.1 hypothetical protein AA21952_1038 [Acetobacter oeni LMG 21952]GEN63075.1 hypothetical protein AOE01nite_12990 [Acetobacter oeni]